MGTMLHAAEPTLDDFQGHEGCVEILNLTLPDVVRGVHDAYLSAGADCVETNTFGANLTALGEYGLSDRIFELSQAGARLAREVADGHSTADRPRFVLGSMGPGTKLPTLGHTTFATLRDAYQVNAAGLLAGGADALIIETCQDLLQVKAAVIGARRAIAASGREVALVCHVTVETTGTMLLGSEIGAALTALEPLGIDLIGMNCATGPAEMSEHLRYLSQNARVPLSVMPNAGLPELTADGARFPLTPAEMAEAMRRFVGEYGARLVGGCCGSTPEHIRHVRAAVDETEPAVRAVRPDAGVSSIYHHVPFAQDASVLMVGERTNANGSKAFRDAMLAGDFQRCVEIARDQARDGSHMLDLCVDYVGRDGAEDMREIAGRFATASTLPIMLDSTEPNVVEAGLEMLGGRCIVNSVNFEDGDGPTSRYARVMPIVAEHGAAVVALTIDEEGQARTAEWKVRVAARLIDDLTGRWGLRVSDILVDCLTFPISTGQEETRRDGIETIEAIRLIAERFPGINFTLGISNISFGLNPAARQVLNSVFLHECQQAGLTSAIVHASKILPMSKIPDEQREVALDMVYDRRREGYDPLSKFIDLFEGVDMASARASRAEELAALPLDERLQRRIIDGERNGLEADLDAALTKRPALAIINDTLLAGMKTVGELFGSGQMQLPFVLQSAEVMKMAVAYLEPHMEKADDGGKGRIVLATVRGDVHDIGKNLVDIILTNNGYEVVNIGIKQPINAILDAAEENNADAIGMSGLLVKSTVIMKENLQEMDARGVSARWPVLLGGAALTRAYVEDDLRDLFGGEVHYARDAFEGLSLMDTVMAAKRGETRGRRRGPRAQAGRAAGAPGTAPFHSGRQPAGSGRLVRSLRRGRRRADPHGAVLRHPGRQGHPARPTTRPCWTNGPRSWASGACARHGAARVRRTRSWSRPRAGPGCGTGWTDSSPTRCSRPRWCTGTSRATPRATRWWCWTRTARPSGPGSPSRASAPNAGCASPTSSGLRTSDGQLDVIAMQLVTVGRPVSEYAEKLRAAHQYRDYFEVHGLSVQLAEALAEHWHRRIRSELTLPTGESLASFDPPDLAGILATDYRGCRYSFGYAACPDLEDRAKISALLEPERIGVVLSEEFQLDPEQSTDAIVVHHPDASYFNAK